MTKQQREKNLEGWKQQRAATVDNILEEVDSAIKEVEPEKIPKAKDSFLIEEPEDFNVDEEKSDNRTAAVEASPTTKLELVKIAKEVLIKRSEMEFQHKLALWKHEAELRAKYTPYNKAPFTVQPKSSDYVVTGEHIIELASTLYAYIKG